MKLSELLCTDRIGLSCELFPPKEGAKLENAAEIVRKTCALRPDYISVTCGAGGTTQGFTAELAKESLTCGVPALAHLTCVGATREQIRKTLAQLRAAGVENILALRGDLPQGMEDPTPVFSHACDLMDEIRAFGGFCIGGACYPLGHPDAVNAEEDIAYLKLKMEHGCSFFTTQLFFDNSVYYHFLYRLLAKGVTVPIVAGIMPVTSLSQLRRTEQLSGTPIPRRFAALAERFGDNPRAMRQAGIMYATEQIIDLYANGVNHVHLYTMNRPDIAREIFANLSEIFVPEETAHETAV